MGDMGEMGDMGDMGETTLFLVRVWQRDGGFHASVRGVGQEEPVHFDAAPPLAEYLRRAAPAPVCADPPATRKGRRCAAPPPIREPHR